MKPLFLLFFFLAESVVADTNLREPSSSQLDHGQDAMLIAKTKKKKRRRKKKVQVEQEETFANDKDPSESSLAARGATSFEADLGGGFIVGSIPGFQIDGYYNLSPTLQLGLSYGSGSVDFSSEFGSAETTIDEASLKTTLIALTGRFFLGNSFYLRGGLALRSLTARFSIKSTLIDYGLIDTVQADTYGVVLGIGNQWQFGSGFSVGCEWLGYTQPLTASTSNTLEQTGTVDISTSPTSQATFDQLQADMEDSAKRLGELGSLRLLVLSFGWAF